MIWDEWATVTRFLESSRFTLMFAATHWGELLDMQPVAADLEFETPGTVYRVSLDQHVSALRNMRPLYSSALVLYYALAEAAVAERLGREDMVGCNGIEDWAEQLLASTGAGWSSDDERIGIVEVGVIRNLVAHGEHTYSKRAVAKLTAAGMKMPPREGDRVVLDYKALKRYRSRLKTLLNRGGLGAAVEHALRPDGTSAV